MKLLTLLIFFSMLATSCFDSAKEEEAGGGLFNGHKPVEDAFTLQVPASGLYNTGDALDFKLVHGTNVNVSGTPRLILDVGGTATYAQYVSGSGTNILTFRYTVQSGENDNDGLSISVNSVDLNSGTLKFSANGVIYDANTAIPNEDTSGIKVDTTAPSISSVFAPLPRLYLLGETLQFTVTYNEAVQVFGTPRLQLDINGTTAYANYSSGSGTILQFTYVVQATDKDETGGIGISSPALLNGGSITDAAGNAGNLTYALPDLSSVTVNGDKPFVTSFTMPGNKTYFNGEMMYFDLTYSEAVTVTGSPKLPIDIGGSIVNANYFAGSGTNKLTFRYIVQTGDKDTNGVTVQSIMNMVGATIQDAGGEDAHPFLNPQLTPYVYVNGDLPTIVGFTAPADADYTDGQNVDFVIEFSENVYVTGLPRIPITLYTGTVYAYYMTGSGSKNITFRYTVANGDNDNDGITFGTNELELNSGTIVSTATGQNALLNYNGLEPNTSNIDINLIPVDHLTITVQPSNTYENAVISPSIVVELRDLANNLVTDAVNNVTLAIANNPAAGTLTGTTTVTAVAGVATFTDLKINNAGAGYTLIASVTGNPGITTDTSSAFNIYSATPTQLVITQEPTNTTAGANINPGITVEVRDAQNNINTSATNNVTLSFGNDASGGSATLGGTLTVAASAGIATFNNINIDKAATGYTLTASSGALTIDTSVGFNITAGPKSKLAFIQHPTQTAINTNINPAITVEIQDTYGNKTADTDNITMAINSNPSTGILSGTTTVAAVNGTATFSDLNIDKTGTGYSLDATATGLTTATSSAFNIVQIPTQLVFTVEPSNAYNSTNISPAIKVEIRDAANQLVTGSSASVTLTIGTDPSGGTATLGGTTTVVAVAGVATFNNINIDKVFTGYTLIASSTGLTTDASVSFDITQAPATQLVITGEPTNTALGANISPAITVELRDANNLLVPNETSSVTLAIGSDPSGGAATLGGTISKAAVGGIATFNDINLDRVGIGYTLIASSGVLTTDTSATFNITQIPTQVVITQQPTNANNSVNIAPAITVEIRDALNQVVTTSSANITLSIGNDPSGSALLGGTVTKSAVSGIATFNNINIDKVGVGYTLVASSTGLSSATSNAFNITQAPATQLVITQEPSNTALGVNINPAITVEFRDANNLLVPNETSNVTLAFGNDPSGSATLGGTTTRAAVGGVATFNDINIDKVGLGYTLVTSSGALTTDTSIAFNITQTATKVAFSVQPSNANNGVNINPAIKVEIRDAANQVVTTSSDNVTLSFGNDPSAGTATLGGTLTVAAVNGVATFNNININKVFTGYTLTASSGALTAATSNSFDITQAPATQLIITQEPTNTEYNSAISPAITVELRDASNNLVPGTDNITIAILNDPTGSATLSGTTTKAAVAGVATFNDLSINKMGTGFTLQVTSGALTSDTSVSFNIVQTATQLVFTQEPTNANTNVAIAPSMTVEVRDAQNNLVSTATNNVTLSFNFDPTGSATLGGTVTQAASGGVATFNNITVNKAGAGYTLAAASTGLTTDVSAAFNITQAPATQLVITQDPGNGPLGVALSPSIIVEFRDANNFLVSNETSNVTLAFGNDPSGSATLGGTTTKAAVAGVATFNDITIDKVGTGFTLTTSSGVLTTDTTTPFNITQVPTQLVITQEPTNTYNSTTISPSITVEIRDANNQLVADATNNITLAIGTNPAAGTLSGTATKAAVGGVATFNDLSINNIGNGYTLVASSGALTTDTSVAFNITQAPATQLVITQEPTNTALGAVISPSILVEFRDANNLIVPNESSNVTLTFGNDPSGSATLGGTTTKAAVNGVATFDNITIDKVGIGFTLVTSSGVLTADTSAAFNVTQTATKVTITQQPTNAYNSTNISPAITVEIRDAANQLVTTATDNVTLAIGTNPASGTLAGTATVAAVGGVATFSNLNIDKVGSGYTLVASSGALTTDTSVAFNITQAPATQLVITQQPTTTTQNTAIAPAITVELRDANNLIVPTETSNVTLAFANDASLGSGAISGTTTKAAVNGVATFDNISINWAANGYTFAITSGALTGATSTAFNITAVPTQLVFTQGPSNTDRDATITPAITVEIRDAANQLVTGSSASVTLAIGTNPAGGTLGGTLTVAASGGIATFSNVNIDTIGTGYTLTASSAGLTGATSAAFNILQPPATQLVITQQPSNTVTGINISPAITVELRDASNQIVPTETSNVTVAIGTNPAGGTLSGTTTVAAASGVATFSNLNIDNVGTGYTLTFSSGILTGATSATFDINPSYSVAVTGAATINNANKNTYQVTGTCSNNGETVTITVGGTVTATPACTANAFTASNMNVSGLTDGSSITVHATHGSASDTSTTVVKDTVNPYITSVVAVTANGNYNTGATIQYTVAFNESVTMVAGPGVNVVIDVTTRNAACTAGTASSFTCTYTIATPDTADNDGVTTQSPLTLGAGSITDANGNTISVLTFTPPDTSGIYVKATTTIAWYYDDESTVVPGSAPQADTWNNGNSVPVGTTVQYKICNTGSVATADLTVGKQGGGKHSEFSNSCGTVLNAGVCCPYVVEFSSCQGGCNGQLLSTTFRATQGGVNTEISVTTKE